MSYALFGGCRHNIFLRDPEVGHKNGNDNVEVIKLWCMLTQDVKGMPYAMFGGVRHYS